MTNDPNLPTKSNALSATESALQVIAVRLHEKLTLSDAKGEERYALIREELAYLSPEDRETAVHYISFGLEIADLRTQQGIGEAPQALAHEPPLVEVSRINRLFKTLDERGFSKRLDTLRGALPHTQSSSLPRNPVPADELYQILHQLNKKTTGNDHPLVILLNGALILPSSLSDGERDEIEQIVEDIEAKTRRPN